MSQELLAKVCLPFAQAAAQDMNPSLRVETGVLNAYDPNLAYKVWREASRLRDLVIFSGDIPWSSVQELRAQELREFFVGQFQAYLTSTTLI